MTTSSNNQRIAKNTAIMYFRMLFVMLITLYSVRIALKILGIEDYGIYNVVAGLVTLLLFVSNSLQTATLRFYSFSMGENDSPKINRIFNLSLFIYSIISIVVLIMGETIGLWFVNTQLTIPPERMLAANWIYQFSLISFIFTILSIPFMAMVIAHEEMGIYAGITSFETVLKLAILYLLTLFTYDKLTLYGFLMLVIVFLKFILFAIYCKHKYSECFLKICWDKKLFKSLVSYSGWTLFGTIAGVANNQGNNILINIFFGPVANAARAVAFQVSNAMASFSSNLFIVLRPPIVKSYAEKNYVYMMQLFYSSSKFSYFLLYMLFLPLLLETEYILNIWLDEVGEYMVIFTQLVLIYSLIMAQNNPITAVVQATGRVKRYFVIVESTTLLSLPLTYLFFKLGYPAEYTFYISIVVFLVAHILRILVLKTLIKLSLKEYFIRFILPVLLVTLLSSVLPVIINQLMNQGISRLGMVALSSMFSIILFAVSIGLNKNERIPIRNYIYNKLKLT